MSELTLSAAPRIMTGRKVKQLRAQGLVPVVVYGRIDEPVNLQIPSRDLESVVQVAGMTQFMRVDVEGGESHNVLVREIQRHPTRHHLLHVDLYAISMTEKQVVSVPIVAIGEPDEATVDTILLQAMDTVEVEALPADLPAHIEVDVTGLTVDDALLVSDLPPLPGVEYLADPDETVFSLMVGRGAEQEEEEELLEELGAEPEVISRGRADEED